MHSFFLKAAPPPLPVAMPPSPPVSAERDPIKIGVTLSGAATGGCYEAGVLDFFIEAMMCLERAREAQPHDHHDPLSHSFPIEVDKVAGTSAGGITALLACASFSMTDYTPLPNHYQLGDAPPPNNPLFRTWVKETNVQRLFAYDDLKRSSSREPVVVRSILNSVFVDTVTNLVVDPRKHIKMPTWADNVELILTNTSLRGTPYSVGPWRSVISDEEKYHMRNCADFVSFRVTTDPHSVPNVLKGMSRVLDLRSELYSNEWQNAISSVKATSAFPGGFPTAAIRTPVVQYSARYGQSPDWQMNVMDNAKLHEYAAVDGGVMNNDPFGIVADIMRRSDEQAQLLRDSGQSEQLRSVGGANAIILVTPFPDHAPDNRCKQSNMSLIETAITLASSLYTGLRFKQHALNERADVPQHFLSPFEGTPGVDARARELACGTLFTFGGLLDERLRLHDFQLGRANCQAFLRNLRVGGERDDARHERLAKKAAEGGGDALALIPLHGSAAETVPLPERVRLSRQQKNRIVNEAARVAADRLSEVVWVYARDVNAAVAARTMGLWLLVGAPLRLLLWFAARALLRPLLWVLFSDALRGMCYLNRTPWWQWISERYALLMAAVTALALTGALLLTAPLTALLHAVVLLLPLRAMAHFTPAVYDALFT
eukprot:TRINITY_DN640_c0_g2_i2.p1 TRINITY_DN640_c0_g2~~TRINITY_DN640_c0_g2_i2.p1  ORF type:complete len:658 (+),score=176.66 TRINITY_DN640_c0_g2_i2:2319-4292(+)